MCFLMYSVKDLISDKLSFVLMYPHVNTPSELYSPKEMSDTLSAVLVILGMRKPSSPLLLSKYPMKIRSSVSKYLPEDTSSLKGFFIFCLRTSKFSLTVILTGACSSVLVMVSSLGAVADFVFWIASVVPVLECSVRVSSVCSAARTIWG